MKPVIDQAARPRAIMEVTGPDGTLRRVAQLNLVRHRPEGQLIEHELRTGETVDLLAHIYFGDAALWPAILDANDLVHPFDLEPGDVLTIPLTSESTRASRARTF